MPALYTSKTTHLEMQENVMSFTDQIVRVGSGGGSGDSEIAPAHLYFLALAKH